MHCPEPLGPCCFALGGGGGGEAVAETLPPAEVFPLAPTLPLACEQAGVPPPQRPSALQAREGGDISGLDQLPPFFAVALAESPRWRLEPAVARMTGARLLRLRLLERWSRDRACIGDCDELRLPPSALGSIGRTSELGL